MMSNPKILEIGPTSNRIVLPTERTDGAVSAVEMTIAAGWVGPPDHRHDTVAHLWYVTAGEVVLRVDGDEECCGPGASVYIPAGVAHGFSTDGTTGGTVLQVDTPGALDRYLDDLAEAFPPGSEVDPAVVGKIMERHDTLPV